MINEDKIESTEDDGQFPSSNDEFDPLLQSLEVTELGSFDSPGSPLPTVRGFLAGCDEPELDPFSQFLALEEEDDLLSAEIGVVATVPVQFDGPAEDFSEIDYCQEFTFETLPPEIIRVFVLFLGPHSFVPLSLVSRYFAESLDCDYVVFRFSVNPGYYPRGRQLSVFQEYYPQFNCHFFSDVAPFLSLKKDSMSWKVFFHCTNPIRLELVSKDAQRFRMDGAPLGMIGKVNEFFVELDMERRSLFEEYSPGDEDRFVSLRIFSVPEVDARPLQKMLEYVEHHWNNRPDEIEKPMKGKIEDVISDYDKRFLEIDQSLLIELIMASNHLNVKDLLDLTCAKVASMLRGKSPEQIREMFGIENDFTPEEEAQIREENKWCEES